MKTTWLLPLVCATALGIASDTACAQGLRREQIEPAKADEIEEFLVSGDAKKIYRALAVNDAPRPDSAIEPLWLFLSEAKETAFRVHDRTVLGYHMVDVLPLVRKALAGYGAASHQIVRQGFQSDDMRKRVEACRVSGMIDERDNKILRDLVVATEDDHGFVRVAALRALPVYGKDAIDPLFKRLKRCSDWRRGGSFSFEEIGAICSSLTALSEHAEETLPRLLPYLDRRIAPDMVVNMFAATAKRLSYANEPLAAELVLPAFEKLKQQGIAASDADYLRKRYELRKKIGQDGVE